MLVLELRAAAVRTPYFWSRIVSMHHIPSELVISFFIPFFSLKFISFFQLASFIPTLTQNWNRSEKCHTQNDKMSQRGVTAKHICFVKFQADSQHMGSKLWTNLEPWELWVDKMGLISKRGWKKKVQKTCWMSVLFFERTFWWVKCKWLRNTRILFPLPYAWV